MGLTKMRRKLQTPPEILPMLRSAVIAKWATECLHDRNVRRYQYEIEEPRPALHVWQNHDEVSPAREQESELI
jgi:hypothetical protein